MMQRVGKFFHETFNLRNDQSEKNKKASSYKTNKNGSISNQTSPLASMILQQLDQKKTYDLNGAQTLHQALQGRDLKNVTKEEEMAIVEQLLLIARNRFSYDLYQDREVIQQLPHDLCIVQKGYGERATCNSSLAAFMLTLPIPNENIQNHRQYILKLKHCQISYEKEECNLLFPYMVDGIFPTPTIENIPTFFRLAKKMENKQIVEIIDQHLAKKFSYSIFSHFATRHHSNPILHFRLFSKKNHNPNFLEATKNKLIALQKRYFRETSSSFDPLSEETSSRKDFYESLFSLTDALNSKDASLDLDMKLTLFLDEEINGFITGKRNSRELEFLRTVYSSDERLKKIYEKDSLLLVTKDRDGWIKEIKLPRLQSVLMGKMFHSLVSAPFFEEAEQRKIELSPLYLERGKRSFYINRFEQIFYLKELIENPSSIKAPNCLNDYLDFFYFLSFIDALEQMEKLPLFHIDDQELSDFTAERKKGAHQELEDFLLSKLDTRNDLHISEENVIISVLTLQLLSEREFFMLRLLGRSKVIIKTPFFSRSSIILPKRNFIASRLISLIPQQCDELTLESLGNENEKFLKEHNFFSTLEKKKVLVKELRIGNYFFSEKLWKHDTLLKKVERLRLEVVNSDVFVNVYDKVDLQKSAPNLKLLQLIFGNIYGEKKSYRLKTIIDLLSLLEKKVEVHLIFCTTFPLEFLFIKYLQPLHSVTSIDFKGEIKGSFLRLMLEKFPSLQTLQLHNLVLPPMEAPRKEDDMIPINIIDEDPTLSYFSDKDRSSSELSSLSEYNSDDEGIILEEDLEEKFQEETFQGQVDSTLATLFKRSKIITLEISPTSQNESLIPLIPELPLLEELIFLPTKDPTMDWQNCLLDFYRKKSSTKEKASHFSHPCTRNYLLPLFLRFKRRVKNFYEEDPTKLFEGWSMLSAIEENISMIYKLSMEKTSSLFLSLSAIDMELLKRPTLEIPYESLSHQDSFSDFLKHLYLDLRAEKSVYSLSSQCMPHFLILEEILITVQTTLKNSHHDLLKITLGNLSSAKELTKTCICSTFSFQKIVHDLAFSIQYNDVTEKKKHYEGLKEEGKSIRLLMEEQFDRLNSPQRSRQISMFYLFLELKIKMVHALAKLRHHQI